MICAHQRDAQCSRRCGPASVIEGQFMSLGQDCRLPQPGLGHGERRAHDFQEIVELVGDIAGRPLQRPRQYIAELVDREVQHMRVKLAMDVSVAYRSCLGQFSLACVVEPCDQHGCIDE